MILVGTKYKTFSRESHCHEVQYYVTLVGRNPKPPLTTALRIASQGSLPPSPPPLSRQQSNIRAMFTNTRHHIHGRFSASCSRTTARSLATSAQKRAAKRLAARGEPPGTAPGGGMKPLDPKTLRKAPHMAKGIVRRKGGIIDTMLEAPFIPMVVIFPTVMMGIALIIRPDMRAQVFGAGETKKKNYYVAEKNAVSVENNKPVGEKEEVALREVQRVANEGALLAGNTDTAVDTQGESKQQTDRPITNEREVRDLIHAIGIRPHQS